MKNILKLNKNSLRKLEEKWKIIVPLIVIIPLVRVAIVGIKEIYIMLKLKRKLIIWQRNKLLNT